MSRPAIILEHNFGELVHLDGDKTITFRVIGVQLFPHGHLFLLAWFKASGDYVEEWFGAWRLTSAS